MMFMFVMLSASKRQPKGHDEIEETMDKRSVSKSSAEVILWIGEIKGMPSAKNDSEKSS